MHCKSAARWDVAHERKRSLFFPVSFFFFSIFFSLSFTFVPCTCSAGGACAIQGVPDQARAEAGTACALPCNWEFRGKTTGLFFLSFLSNLCLLLYPLSLENCFPLVLLGLGWRCPPTGLHPSRGTASQAGGGYCSRYKCKYNNYSRYGERRLE